jgi:hypothetical protein
VVLDSGTVLIALGWDEQGMLVSSLERFDPRSQRFEKLGPLPEHRYAAVTALEGDRLAYVGCDGPDTGCELALFSFDADVLFQLDPMIDMSEVNRSLEQLRLQPLHDGRLLLTGRDPTALLVRQAFVLDLNQAAIVPSCTAPTAPVQCTDVSRVPEHLLELEDGTLVELDATGASLSRMDVRSTLDDAPTPLVDKNAVNVALDAVSRWQRDRGLFATENARFDLPYLRFGNARIALQLNGTGAILLKPRTAPPVKITIGSKALALENGCTLPRAKATDPITVTRRGDALLLETAGRSQSCTASHLGERIGVAMRVDMGGRVTALSVERL